MSIVPITPQPGPDQPPEILQVIPSDGSWWRLQTRRHPASSGTFRQRVLAWALVRQINRDGSAYTLLEPFLEGDGSAGELASVMFPDGIEDRLDNRLWHDGDSYCSCRTEPIPSDDTDDIWWCERCAGTITPER